jgi:hypothetical protein
MTVAFCQILPAVHSLTGCDSTSAMFGLGKRYVFKTVIDNPPEKFASLTVLAGSDEDAAADESRRLVAALYDPKGKNHDLRVTMATKKNASLIKLPPCEASFKQHVKRVSWKTKKCDAFPHCIAKAWYRTGS